MPIPKRKPSMIAVHPGEFLREDFLKPLGMSANALALALRVPATRISEIVNERRGLTTDTALRLAQYFGTSLEYWVNMQKAYEIATISKQMRASIAREVQRRVA